MRSRLLSIAVIAVAMGLGGAPAVAAPTVPAENPTDTYYVSMGDSLAAGYQPNTKKDEPVSYSDRVYETLKASDPHLQFVRIGCDGETTASMINGGKCVYPGASSQLDFATKFLAAHQGRVEYLTLTVGANDIYHCLTGGSGSAGLPDIGCITQSLGTIGTNLGKITGELHKAGGTDPRYVGMNYYDPALAGWLEGGTSQLTAQATAAANNLLAATIASANSANGFKTADVLNAFSNNDVGNPVDVPPFGTLPRNVARICAWTWMCSMADIHANPVGHQIIADAFLPLLTSNAPGAGTGSSGS
ncbi:GDSL-type esterase/lipase family protein [Rhodococcus sp. NPDC127528]|uniref:GDSL-type esterase/lipase family protein n=1 Tax=unclassified Rhodococcus (in: high G+C Gram-positive bacteria) TaxID=192944 RepID=UPI0036381962